MLRIAHEGLTFDDVLLLPGYSEVTAKDVSLVTRLTRNIPLNIPLVSATTLGSIGKSFYLLLQERAQRYLTRLCAKKPPLVWILGRPGALRLGQKLR